MSVVWKIMLPLLAMALAIAPTASAVSYNFTTLDVPQGTYTHASGINDAGQIVGYYDNGGTLRGFSYSAGAYTTLVIPGDELFNKFAMGINNDGNISGNYTSGDNLGFLKIGATYNIIAPSSSSDTHAFGLNNSNWVVGYYYSGTYHGFIKNGTGYSNLDLSGALYTFPKGINDNTVPLIVGDYVTSSYARGFIYNGTGYDLLHYPGSANTYANGINDAGYVVGFYDTHGYVYFEGSYSTIDVPGAKDTGCLDINNLGQIVGWYTDNDNNRHGFMAEPVPAPCSLLLLGSGLLGLGAFGRRKMG